MKAMISRYRFAFVCSLAILAFTAASSWSIWSAMSLSGAAR
jgi:hypothetical protein